MFTPALGRDFNPDVSLSAIDQVDKLIKQATSLENLCQLFSGWSVKCYSIINQVLLLIPADRCAFW